MSEVDPAATGEEGTEQAGSSSPSIPIFVLEILNWVMEPTLYPEYKTNLVDECKLGFGNILRAEMYYHRAFNPVSYWIQVLFIPPVIGFVMMMTN